MRPAFCAATALKQLSEGLVSRSKIQCYTTDIADDSHAETVSGWRVRNHLNSATCFLAVTIDIPLFGYSALARCLACPAPLSVVHLYSSVNEGQKKDYADICTTTPGDGLDLELVSEDQDDIDWLVEKGIKRGVARRFLNDIPQWAKRQKEFRCRGLG